MHSVKVRQSSSYEGIICLQFPYHGIQHSSLVPRPILVCNDFYATLFSFDKEYSWNRC